MKTAEIVRDLSVLAGAGLFIAGLWRMWPPLGLIAAGLLLGGLSILWELDQARRKAAAERDRRTGY